MNAQELAQEQVVSLLWDYLPKDPAHDDRRQTGWGNKTKAGLTECVLLATETYTVNTVVQDLIEHLKTEVAK